MKCMTLTVLCCLAIGSYAGARDKPGDSPKIQRSWLRGALLGDMAEIDNRMAGTFLDLEYARAKAIANRSAGLRFKISDEDFELLVDYYRLTRARAEKDQQQFRRQFAGEGQFPGQLPEAGQFQQAGQLPEQRQLQAQGQIPNPPQAGLPEAELKAAQAERDAIIALGEKLAKRSEAVRSLAVLIYASVPGYCVRQWQMMPASHFHFDAAKGRWAYVGPAHDNAYAGPHAASLDNHFNAEAARPQRPMWIPSMPVYIPGSRGTGNGNLQGRGGLKPLSTGAWPENGTNGPHR